jgi:hypothetical protein
MALGDGIRRNIAHVSDIERDRFIDAVVQLNSRYYPDGVSKWVKQDEIHEATHVHGGPSFLPWHRELLNRYEELLREIDPDLSLHYWDWTDDPRAADNGAGGTYNIFTESFMGEGNGNVAAPFAGFPPISRDIAGGAAAPTPPGVDSDVSIVDASNGFAQNEQWNVFRTNLESSPNHNSIHGYVGGTIGPAHTAFEDPFVFVMHANIDRLWARWQTVVGQEWRLNPLLTYGDETSHASIVETLEPWDGGSGLRPWAAPDNQQLAKDSKDISIVIPPCYDTNFNLAPNVEVDNAGTPAVINFNDIPSGDTASRAAVFKIYGCSDATIRVKAGSEPASPFSILYPPSSSITVEHALAPYTIARIWLGYTAGAANVAVPDGAVTFECVESGQEFSFVIKANSIIRPRVAVMLALDQSGSMAWDAGTSGLTRLDVLKDAAIKFMEIIPFDNGVGLIRFDSDAYPVNHATYPGMDVSRINNEADRLTGINAVTNHGAFGGTSVGDGVQLARDILNALPAADYEEKALIVFTDGMENEPVSIASVSGSINNRTFAIGLGNESQVNTSALNQLTNGTGGYLKLTGLLTNSIDDYFLLPKYFLQILAGVTNNNIILDPTGYISNGQEIRIPFIVNEADLDATVILMVDMQAVDIVIETPNGDIIEPNNIAGLGIDYSVGKTSKNYKFNLPVAFPAGNHTGEWFVILKINPNNFKKQISILRDVDPKLFQSAATHGVRYSVIVNTYSNLKMIASVNQSSFEPMANISLRSLLTEYGLPIENRANVNVEVTRPDSTKFIVQLAEIEPGIFEKIFVANTPGTYHCRFLANGATIRGNEFTREQTLNAAVFQGGDRPTAEPTDPGKDGTISELFKKCCQRVSVILTGVLILVLILVILLLRG